MTQTNNLNNVLSDPSIELIEFTPADEQDREELVKQINNLIMNQMNDFKEKLFEKLDESVEKNKKELEYFLKTTK